MRWPEGPPHLALNPPYLLFVSFLFFFCFCGVFCFGGFKGQVRWPKGPPHLALSPPYLFVVLFFFFSFPFFASNRRNPVFPPRKGHFCLFLNVSLCFSLAFFGLPLFQLLFLCLSLLLFFLSSFLPVFHFCFLLLPCFWSLSFLFFLLCFCFMKRTSKYSITKSFFINIFSLFGFLSSFLFEIPFSYLFLLILILCFLFNIIVFRFKKPKLITPIFGQKGGCNKTVFFMNLCLANYEKLSFFLGPFFGKIWLMFKTL